MPEEARDRRRSETVSLSLAHYLMQNGWRTRSKSDEPERVHLRFPNIYRKTG
ncbi:hypothetical protein QJS04_geneDACA009308 [Acorus gramineus]|uniref:Uncharacterized protein n=1 Tax=Acorus gramineus TaxID=55184 RepID=A0AAV9AG57_ACOGR|nr:hypothetical protein QJS04_geneDACA009308 [Acorus gramineus]